MADGVGLNSFTTSRLTKRLGNVNAAANTRRKSRPAQSQRRTAHHRVVLERVLGITTSNSSGLACDPNTGLVAYPAGCVVVILHPKKNKQTHILNASRKTFTALAFSQDGKYLVTGESGHMPCVRVWDVAEQAQVAEVQCHKYGVACVVFSTNSSYIVSVGYQHDMTVSVWEWRKGTVIASNKVSSRVLSVSFSEDNSYFVTAGNRHVKFWYLDASKERRVNSTVPLIGRSGLLGEQRNSMFCGLSCGRGNMASSTYCITSSGLLCQFNSRRMLDAWVDLKTTSARCLSVNEVFIFCGCADGTVRLFSPQNLHYVTTLHRPHCLGVDITQGLQPGHLFVANPEAQYPDTLALTFDPVTRHLTCVYNDHSVYVWDVRDIKNVGKVYSALYHSGCVWSLETYPDMDLSRSCLPPGSFLTCSSDNTIRLWHSDPGMVQGTSCLRNLYSHDLLRIVYVGEDTQHLQTEGERGEGGGMDAKSGIRVLGISPDGQHLAAGDRNGNVHIFGLQFMDQLQKIEAHDSEVLCLEFSPAETGLHLLASASRDRLIHIFNMEKSYSLEQTVYDHSASITAIKFTGVSPEVLMVSCGADKSIYFRTAEQSSEGLNFARSHHVVEKTTLYDMDLDATHTHAAIACQDRNIRVYNVKSGKMKKCFKGSISDDGTLLKVQMDPAGIYLATSCSDKSICIFDYESGECVATLFGHSEIVTGMRFSQDCRHLITISGDSCVFLWRLDSQMTNSMRKRLAERKQTAGVTTSARAPTKEHLIRRETFITVPLGHLPQAGEEEEEDPRTPARCDITHDFLALDPMVPQTNGKLPMWARKLGPAAGTTALPAELQPAPLQPRGRWAEHLNPLAIRSVLETHSLQRPLSPTPRRAEGPGEEEEDEEEDPYFHPQSLDSLLGEEDEEEEDVVEEEEDDEVVEEEEDVVEDDDEDQGSGSLQRPGFLALPDSEDMFGPGLSSPERSSCVLYPANSTTLSTGGGEGEFGQQHQQQQGWGGEDELSPDSACCVGSAENQDQPQDDTDSLSQVSSTGSSGVEEEEEDPQTLLRQHFDTMANHLSNEEKFETDLSSLQTPPIETESLFLNPRFSISTRFLSRFQSRLRGPGSALRPAPLPPSITEEPSSHSCLDPTPSLNTTQANSKQLVVSSTTESLQEESQIPDVTDKTLRSQSSGPSSSSSTLKPSQPGLDKEPLTRLPRQRYMGTTTSSRAKRSQGEGLNISPTEEHPAGGKIVEARASSLQDLQNITDSECKENLPPSAQPPVVQPPVVQPPVVQPPVVQPPVSHTTTTSLVEPPAPASQPPSVPPSPAGNYSARAALHLDLAVPSDPPTLTFPLASHKSQRRFGDSTRPTRHALVTPTEMRSLGKDAKRCLRNMEDSLGPRGGSSGLRSSMAPATSPATAMAPAPATSPAPTTAPAMAPAPTTAMAPAPTTTTAPATSPAPTTAMAPAPTTAPATAPAPTTAMAPAPATSPAPTTAPAMAPAPATSPAPTTAPAMAPVPATTLEPTTAMALAPTMAPTPRLCPTLPQAQLTESPSHLPLLQQASDSPVSGSACSFPLHGDSGLHGDSVEETLNLQMCHQVANELRHTVRRAVTFYNKVCCMTDSSEQQGQMSAILKEAFSVAQTELDSVFPSGQRSAAGPSAPCPMEDSPGRQLRDDRTVALLEKYSEMLLCIAEKKMDSS